MTTANTNNHSGSQGRAGWFSRFSVASTEYADVLDRQRERDMDAQALAGVEALLLTDVSPVSFPFERCWGVHKG